MNLNEKAPDLLKCLTDAQTKLLIISAQNPALKADKNFRKVKSAVEESIEIVVQLLTPQNPAAEESRAQSGSAESAVDL